MYGLTFWILATCLYFIFNLTGFELAPIAKDGPNSLISVYIPVLVLTVFLLLYLTRNRTVSYTHLTLPTNREV